MSGIINNDVHITALGFDNVFEPVDALVVDFLTASVVQHFYMAGGDAEGVHKVLVQHVTVVACKFAVGQRGGVFFVGYDEGVSLAVEVLLDRGDVEIDVLIVLEGGFHGTCGIVESTMHHYLQAAAAVVGTGHVETTGNEPVVVDGLFEIADIFIEEAAHALCTQIGQLCICGDSILLVDRYAHILIVEDGGHVAEIAVFAIVVDVGYLGRVGSGGNGDSGLTTFAENVAQFFFYHGLGQIADGTAGI